MYLQSLVYVVVQKLAYVLNENQGVNFVDLGWLHECFIFAYVDQCKVLSHPLHEVRVLLSNSCELRGLCWQTGTTYYKASKDFFENVRFRPCCHLRNRVLRLAGIKRRVEWWSLKVWTAILRLRLNNGCDHEFNIEVLVNISQECAFNECNSSTQI